jgi:amidase/aspartyl-tRNA(Asn)/glutamyl-tRNA(Gln) amidotransferase subunit A
MAIAGEEVLVRPTLGLYTQPLSFISLPVLYQLGLALAQMKQVSTRIHLGQLCHSYTQLVLSVPIHLPGYLPLGVQIIAAPYNEALILRVAAVLESHNKLLSVVQD